MLRVTNVSINLAAAIFRVIDYLRNFGSLANLAQTINPEDGSCKFRRNVGKTSTIEAACYQNPKRHI
jgi:hypothetical protein